MQAYFEWEACGITDATISEQWVQNANLQRYRGDNKKNNKTFMPIDIRQQIRTKRRELTADFKKNAATKIIATLINADVFKQSNDVATYLPTEGEVDTSLLIEQLWQQEKNCYLPILAPNQTKNLSFIKYAKNDVLIKNKYDILEPVYDETKCIDAKNLDLVITPLVGFDERGYRMGRGGGYYDRTFAFKRTQLRTTKPWLIGLAYELQKIAITPQEWDIPLLLTITERRTYLK